MRTDVQFLLPVLFKNEITTEIFALFTVPENVMMVKLNAQEKETILDVKDQTSVYHWPKNYGVMMLETGAQDFALPTALTGKTTVLQYKTLVTVAQPNQPANQKQKTSTVFTAQPLQLLMVALFLAKH